MDFIQYRARHIASKSSLLVHNAQHHIEQLLIYSIWSPTAQAILSRLPFLGEDRPLSIPCWMSTHELQRRLYTFEISDSPPFMLPSCRSLATQCLRRLHVFRRPTLPCLPGPHSLKLISPPPPPTTLFTKVAGRFLHKCNNLSITGPYRLLCLSSLKVPVLFSVRRPSRLPKFSLRIAAVPSGTRSSRNVTQALSRIALHTRHDEFSARFDFGVLANLTGLLVDHKGDKAHIEHTVTAKVSKKMGRMPSTSTA